MTEKLFYADSHISRFTAEVLSCEPYGDKFAVVLDRTAFFPEGGGQPGDCGWLNDVAVVDTREERGEILHVCEDRLPVGAAVEGKLNWPLRFARMQGHSAEHILSGIAYNTWGCHNVGFHMPEKDVTLDFDRELSEEEIRFLEQKANETVWANVPVRGYFPPEEELSRLSWRQKKELQGPIRLVEIKGVDLCACCVPHVKQTGEIGVISIIEAMRHRGGTRLTMRAGTFALENILRQKQDETVLSHLFSAPKDALPAAGRRVLQELENRKAALAEAERTYTMLRVETMDTAPGNRIFFENQNLGSVAMREMANAGADKIDGICGVFAGEDGSWKYILCSRTVNLKEKTKEINNALSCRGGGSAEMIQGSCTASRSEIEQFFKREKE